MRKIASIIIILMGVVLGYFLFKSQLLNLSKKANYEFSSKKTTEKKLFFNVLLLGYGGVNHDGSYLTDTMMVARIDLKKNKIFLISIPRDIWINLETKSKTDFYTKINAVYQLELFKNDFSDVVRPKVQGELMKSKVNEITGLPIDNLISINFDAFKKAIDILGGIDISVEKTLIDNQYPIYGKESDNCGKNEEEFLEAEKLATESPEIAFPCRYEKLFFEKGLTHMNGETALKYVRSRHGYGDSGDFNRARRQQIFIEALKNKIISLNFIPKIPLIISEIKQDIRFDFDINKIASLLKEAGDVEKYQITSLILDDKNYLVFDRSSNGQSILIPKQGLEKWEEIKKGVDNFINEIKISPTKVTEGNLSPKKNNDKKN